MPLLAEDDHAAAEFEVVVLVCVFALALCGRNTPRCGGGGIGNEPGSDGREPDDEAEEEAEDDADAVDDTLCVATPAVLLDAAAVLLLVVELPPSTF